MRKISRREMLKMIGVGTAGAMITACTPKETSVPTSMPTPTKAPPVKITMVESWFAVPQDKAILDAVNQVISEKMQSEGVNVEIQSMVLEDHTNKYPLLYSSGADFTMAFDAPWYKMDSLRTQGSLVVLDDLFKTYGSGLMAEVTDRILAANKWDDHWYGIPTAGSYGSSSGVILRKDLLEKYNPTAPDEIQGWPTLEAYLQSMADNEPDMTPFVVNSGFGPVHENFLLHRRTGTWNGVNAKTGIIIPNIDNGYTLMDVEEVPEIQDMATLLRSWWEKGLVNKTDVTYSGPSGTDPVDFLLPGKAATVVENGVKYKYVDYQRSMQASLPETSLAGYDLSGIEAGRYRPIGALKQWNFIVFNASASQEEQIAGVQYFNWLVSSQDNIDLWLMGIDGVNYKKESDLRFSEIEGVDQSKNYRRQWYVGGVSGRFMRYSVDLPEEAMISYKWENDESKWDFDPYEAFNLDLKEVETETAQLNAAWAEAYHGLGTGQLATEEAIATMKKTLDDAGRQAYKEKVQKQLDDYIAAN